MNASRLIRFGFLGAAFLLLPLSGESQAPRGNRDLVLDAVVTPDPAPLGAVLSFQLTVTNTGNHPASFSVEGCPVHYRIDGSYSPREGCAEIHRTFTLDAGKSVTFGPGENPHLDFDPALYPLSPGRHRVVMAVENLGGAAAEFRVLPPADFAFVSGHVVEGEGKPAASGFVRVYPEPFSREVEPLQVPLSPDGNFMLKALAPGKYLLEVTTAAGTFWYPAPPGSGDSPPLELSAQEYRELRVSFPGKRSLFPLEGMVFEAPEDGEAVPLLGATVVALPDAGPGVPSTSSEGEPGFQFYTRTGADGVFRLELPPGSYRLLAGKLGEFRYRYWNGSESAGGETVLVPGVSPDKPIRFDLSPLRDSPLSVLQGRVFVESPSPRKTAEPLENATVAAIPVLPSEIAAAPQRARTGPGGTFHMEVPADTPYRLRAEAPGHRPCVYEGDGYTADDWIETSPGTRVPAVEMFLPPSGARNRGALEGAVYRRLSTEDCASGTNCLVPASGVEVRVIPAEGGFGPREYRTRTGPEGGFRLEGIPANREYFVAARAGNRENVYVPGGVPLSLAATRRVLPGETAGAGRIVLNPEASETGGEGFLGGTVTDRAGRPLENVAVRVYLQPEVPEGPVIPARTDAAGRFWIPGLDPGAPVLVAASGKGLIPVYYPDATRWQDARRVSAAGPSDRMKPLAFRMEAADGSGFACLGGRVEATPEVSGTLEATVVSSTRPRPLEGAFLYLENPDTGVPVAGGRTLENGTAFLTGVPGDDYLLRADCPGYTPSAEGAFEAARRIHLEAGQGIVAAVLLHPRSPEPGARTVPVEPGILSAVGNAPNPFRSPTHIQYRLERAAAVTLQVFDYRGRLVRTLLEDREQAAGLQQVSWDARDEDGQRVSSGVYFFRIFAGSSALSRKMVVLP